MKSQHIEDNIAHQPLDRRSPHQQQEHVPRVAGLAITLGHLKDAFRGYTHADDLDIFEFTLLHLFEHIDLLYQVALPSLVESASQITKQQSPPDTSSYQHQIWNQLQRIKQILERIAPFCQLLDATATRILEALDTDNQAPPKEISGESTDHLAKQDWQQIPDQQQWEHSEAMAIMAEYLIQWQQYPTRYGKDFSFAVCFSELNTIIASSPQMDVAFDMVRESATALYGEILRDFQPIPTGNSAEIAAFLFDLMQKVDQLLLYIDMLQEPLYALIKRHTSEI